MALKEDSEAATDSAVADLVEADSEATASVEKDSEETASVETDSVEVVSEAASEEKDSAAMAALVEKDSEAADSAMEAVSTVADLTVVSETEDSADSEVVDSKDDDRQYQRNCDQCHVAKCVIYTKSLIYSESLSKYTFIFQFRIY